MPFDSLFRYQYSLNKLPLLAGFQIANETLNILFEYILLFQKPFKQADYSVTILIPWPNFILLKVTLPVKERDNQVMEKVWKVKTVG